MQEKTIEKKVFVSEDGREFTSEVECLEHEQRSALETEYRIAQDRLEKCRVEFSKKELPGLIPLSQFSENDGNLLMLKGHFHRRMSDYEFFQLASKADAEAMATVMAFEDTNTKSTKESILKASGKITFPCLAMRSPNYHWDREICTFEKEMRLVEKYCKVHGYRIKLEKI